MPVLAHKKTHAFKGGDRLMRECWIERSGYLMKRQCVEQSGLLPNRRSFTGYCISLARSRCIHSWYCPLLYQKQPLSNKMSSVGLHRLRE